jgi:hypothetical protein
MSIDRTTVIVGASRMWKRSVIAAMLAAVSGIGALSASGGDSGTATAATRHPD